METWSAEDYGLAWRSTETKDKEHGDNGEAYTYLATQEMPSGPPPVL